MKRFLRHYAATITAVLITVVPGAAFADSHAVDPEADKILRQMSSYLGELSAFSVRASVENEVITDAGQKLQLISNARLAIERPAKLNFERKGPLADVRTLSDGSRFTMYNRISNLYIEREAPATIDDAIRLVEFETGLPAPAADLMFADAYAVLKPGIREASYLGTAVIDGIESHHLAFRGDQADWQLWVQTGQRPLPTRYVITSKWLTGAPQFSLRFLDWNTSETFDAGEFAFAAPADARKVEVLPLEMGNDQSGEPQ